MTEAAEKLTQVLEAAAPRLASFSDAQASEPRGPEKWSRKQVLGHLIDSASNNHQRIVRMQLGPHLEFPGYMQKEWVSSQQYATESWPDMVQLWRAYNRHLVHIIRAIPPDKLANTWALAGKQLTLSFMVDDYVVHLEHHLAQILG